MPLNAEAVRACYPALRDGAAYLLAGVAELNS